MVERLKVARKERLEAARAKAIEQDAQYDFSAVPPLSEEDKYRAMLGTLTTIRRLRPYIIPVISPCPPPRHISLGYKTDSSGGMAPYLYREVLSHRQQPAMSF